MVIKQAFLVVSIALALALSGCSRQQSDWERTRTANTADAYELFLKKYPSGEFTGQAKAQIKGLYEERDWQRARDSDTLEAYQAFLKAYPEGKWTEEARIRVENFTLATAPSTPAPAGAETPPAAAPKPSKPAPKPSKPASQPSKPAPRSSKPAAVAASVPAAMKRHGSYSVQLGAFKSGAQAANTRWARLEQDYAGVLSGLTPKVSAKKLASGTLYRLQVANLSEKRANSICQALKAHAQACVLIRP
jgi:cell division septation protein DedD